MGMGYNLYLPVSEREARIEEASIAIDGVSATTLMLTVH
jgi:hypothetical protein